VWLAACCTLPLARWLLLLLSSGCFCCWSTIAAAPSLLLLLVLLCACHQDVLGQEAAVAHAAIMHTGHQLPQGPQQAWQQGNGWCRAREGGGGLRSTQACCGEDRVVQSTAWTRLMLQPGMWGHSAHRAAGAAARNPWRTAPTPKREGADPLK
jgi:hypothetical protein